MESPHSLKLFGIKRRETCTVQRPRARDRGRKGRRRVKRAREETVSPSVPFNYNVNKEGRVSATLSGLKSFERLPPPLVQTLFQHSICMDAADCLCSFDCVCMGLGWDRDA